VRLAKLDADYARAPHLKPSNGSNWELVSKDRLEQSHYLIAVDEFAEVELPGYRGLTREEYRKLCDRGKTRESILHLLRNDN
jgi:hypothetical protein